MAVDGVRAVVAAVAKERVGRELLAIADGAGDALLLRRTFVGDDVFGGLGAKLCHAVIAKYWLGLFVLLRVLSVDVNSCTSEYMLRQTSMAEAAASCRRALSFTFDLRFAAARAARRTRGLCGGARGPLLGALAADSRASLRACRRRLCT